VFTARVIWNGVVFLSCIGMAVTVYQHRSIERQAVGTAA
jgi:hypothetical protein